MTAEEDHQDHLRRRPRNLKGVAARGRKWVHVDLKDDTSRGEEVIELLGAADALIQGFRPGVMERLGLGPDVILTRSSTRVWSDDRLGSVISVEALSTSSVVSSQP